MAESNEKTIGLGAVGDLCAIQCAGLGGVAFQITGTFVGTVTFEGSADGRTFASLLVTPIGSTSAVTTATAPGVWMATAVGLLVVRARLSAHASGVVQVTARGEVSSPGGGGGGGSSGGGTSSDFDATFPITGTAAGGLNVSSGLMKPLAINDNGELRVATSGSGSNSAAGPTGDPVPADADFIGFEDPTGDLVGFHLEDFDFDSGAGSQPQTTIGLVQPADGGPVPVGPAAPLYAQGSGTAGTPAGGILSVQGVAGGTPQPVSAASLPLPTGASTLAEQQTQSTALAAIKTAVEIMDDWDESDRAKVNLIVGQAGVAAGTGVDGATVQRVSLATNVPLPTGANAIGKLAANSGIDIGDVDVTSLPALVAGAAIIGKVGIDQTTPGTTNGVQVNAALPAGANVIGQVTANAGTNLNTSLLALEAGGNLAAAAASLAIMDDWDEVDRAKVNLVVGQSGVAGGTGADAANVQRVSLATNVGLPAGTALLGKVGIDQTTPGTTNAVAPIAGQNGVQGGAGAVNALTQRVAIATDANAITAVGTVADDGITPGAPVMVGGQAKSPDGTDPGNVSAEDDVARAITDLNRRVFVNTLHPRFGHKNLNGSTAYADEPLIADPGDGFQIVITNIIGSTGDATALNFFLEEGGTIIFGPIYLEAVNGRGFASGPINIPVTASTAVTLTSSASIPQSFDVAYFVQKV